MALLIDGYNLIYAAGIIARGVGPGGLQRTRMALLNFIAESLDPAEATRTTIVFDAAGAPPGLPPTLKHRGLTVRFSRDYDNADELIEELIKADSAPRRLTVVSSDHRLQRAARKRKARAVDSDQWYREMLDLRQEKCEPSPRSPAKPTGSSTAGEVEYWLEQFDEKDERDIESKDDIFPPGYGEDVAE
jgi:uncharacterized protein